MPDPRFFERRGPHRLASLAELSGATLSDPADADFDVADVAPLHLAGAREISFLDNRLYVDAFRTSRAGACIVAAEHVAAAPRGMRLLVAKSPYLAYALVATAFYPAQAVAAGIDSRACVDPSAKIGAGAVIGPGAVVEAQAEIGARCRIASNAVIGRAVRLGEDCEVGAGATLSHCLIGARALIHPGVRIGQRGFGFAPARTGYVKVPQLGRVIVGDDVEIGANTTIDRGAGPDTVIGDGCMIDNLVQIGHNVTLGPGCILVAQVGISGSTSLGERAMLGGQAGLTGHLKIGAGAQIAAQSGVMRDVAPGERVMGSPAQPIREHLKQVAFLSRLARKKGD
jgi:UDP-3-O-[3-hydroxymyristoyl] glucosamine N-acyltransferase